MDTSTSPIADRAVVRVDTRTVVLLATAVIALHVADDSFIQPQPGTSAADHLVSGRVVSRRWSSPPRRCRGCAPVRGPS